MLDTSGLYRIRYADVFRALGNYLDAELFRDITLVETTDGFFAKGQVLGPSTSGGSTSPRTYLFADADLDVLIEQAYRRRGMPQPPDTLLPSITIDGQRARYEDVLRAIGTYIDTHRWRDVVVMQTATQFHVKGNLSGGYVDILLGSAELRQLIEDLKTIRPRKGKLRFWPRA